jgi:hypothetical protein
MPGFVDFEVFSKDGLETILDPPQLQSIPICKIKAAELWQV